MKKAISTFILSLVLHTYACAAVSEVTGLNIKNGSAGLLIGWDQNTEPDLAGYRTYLLIAQESPSWQQLGDIQIAEFLLDTTNIGGKEIDFAVSAYDTADNESDWSIIHISIPNKPIYHVPIAARKLNLRMLHTILDTNGIPLAEPDSLVPELEWKFRQKWHPLLKQHWEIRSDTIKVDLQSLLPANNPESGFNPDIDFLDFRYRLCYSNAGSTTFSNYQEIPVEIKLYRTEPEPPTVQVPADPAGFEVIGFEY